MPGADGITGQGRNERLWVEKPRSYPGPRLGDFIGLADVDPYGSSVVD